VGGVYCDRGVVAHRLLPRSGFFLCNSWVRRRGSPCGHGSAPIVRGVTRRSGHRSCRTRRIVSFSARHLDLVFRRALGLGLTTERPIRVVCWACIVWKVSTSTSAPTASHHVATHAATLGVERRRIAWPAPTQGVADLVSCIGAVMCVAAGIALAAGAPLVTAAVLFPLGASFDLADGKIARGSASRRREVGAFIDSICDKIGETGMALGLFVAAGSYTVDLLIAISYGLGSLTSYTKAFAGEHRLAIDWPEARRYGLAGRVILLSATLAAAVIAPQHEQTTLIIGLTALASFNLGTFIWRLTRVIREVR